MTQSPTHARTWHHDPEADQEGEGVTHAIVIGCSAYTNSGQSEFQSPDPAVRAASSALALARFLIDVPWHRPLASIELCLSPSADEAESTEFAGLANSRNADSTSVRRALEAWRHRCRGDPRNVAVFYIAGHGVIYGTRDHSILLEDYGEYEEPMLGSVDVGSVYAGMVGPDLPFTQFYVVDACRVPWEQGDLFDDAGHGVGLSSRRGVVDDRAAPIFTGALPGTVAWSEHQNGTLLSQALCTVLLRGEAVDDAEIDGEPGFAVTAESLFRPLQAEVARLAATHGIGQTLTRDGLSRGDAVLVRHPRPPRLEVSVQLSPCEIAPYSRLDVRSNDFADFCTTVPLDETGQGTASVLMGWSTIDLDVPAKFAPHSGWPGEERIATPSSRRWRFRSHRSTT